MFQRSESVEHNGVVCRTTIDVAIPEAKTDWRSPQVASDEDIGEDENRQFRPRGFLDTRVPQVRADRSGQRQCDGPVPVLDRPATAHDQTFQL